MKANLENSGAAKGLASVQALRGFAAIAVVCNHCLSQVTSDGHFLPKEFFAFGVDIFFVISGFIMIYISSTKYVQPTQFITERIKRIFPLYFIFTSMVALTASLSPSAVRHSSFAFEHYLLSVFFIPHINPSTMTYSPLLRLGWTLNLEIYFYAIFALSMAINYRMRLWLSFIIITSILITTRLFPDLFGALVFYSNDIVLEFGFGMVLGWVFGFTHRTWPRSISLILALSAICFMFYVNIEGLSLPRSVGWGLPSSVLVWSALMLDRSRLEIDPVVIFAGDSSYSLYLSHLFVISALRIVWMKFHMPTDSWQSLAVFTVIGVVLAILVGSLTYLIIERPIMQIIRRYRNRTSTWSS